MKMMQAAVRLLLSVSLLYSFATAVWADIYRLGVPQGYNAPTYKLLFAALEKRGVFTADNLKIVPIDLSGYQTEAGRDKIRKRVANETDLFFITGDHMGVVSAIEITSPLLFVAIANPDKPLPPTMKNSATGFYWSSIETVFKRSAQLLPEAQRKKMGLIFYRGSTLSTRSAGYKRACEKLGINLVVKSFDGQDDIQRVMREFKQEGVGGVILLPPAIRRMNGELGELIKWQFKLKLPIIAHRKDAIKKGALGGPVIELNRVASKLSEYATKLLTGREPSQLPIKYLQRKNVINLATASKIGVDIPQAVLTQAEIIGIGVRKKIVEERQKSLVPGQYSIGVAKNIPTPAWHPLRKELEKWGYVEGENLRIVPIDLSGADNPIQQQRIVEQMESEIDLFISTGNILPRLFQLSGLSTPVCFLSIKELTSLPPEIRENFTGVVRGSFATIIEMARAIFSDANRIGILYRPSSNLPLHTLTKMQQQETDTGIEFEVRSFSSVDEIGSKMQELKQQSDFVLLFPPSINKGDIDEVIKWQNRLNLPVVSQLRSRIEKGLLGGSTIDWDVVLPKMAEYVDKLLQGRKASALPIYYYPDKYVINLKTASRLEVQIPSDVTSKADIVY